MKKKLFHIRGNPSGFTLAETMVVVSLMGILTGIGYSGYTSWQRSEQVRAATFQLRAYLQETRMLAIEKQISHAVIFAADQYSIVRETVNPNCILDGTDVVVRQVTTLPQKNIIVRFPSSSQINAFVLNQDRVNPTLVAMFPNTFAFRYDRRGIPRTCPAGINANFNVLLSNSQGVYKYLTLSGLGRIVIAPQD